MTKAQQTEFPKALQQAITYFSDAENCVNFLSQLRWPEGVVCPNCEGREVSYLSTRRLWKCKACKKQFSVKVGSLMEDSPIGLDKWLAAIWIIANAKNGVSSYEIARSLGVTQKTGWFLLHRLRLAMQTGTFSKLSGHVEIDDTFIGGLARNMHRSYQARKIHGTGGAGKVAVMGAEKYVEGNVHTNGIENFWSLLKRMIKGTYVSVEPFHLFRYLDEQSFRFDTRKGTDADRFVKAAGCGLDWSPPFTELIARAAQ